MAINLCGVDGCRNPIKDGASGCWRHPDGISSKTGASGKPDAVSLDDQARRSAVDDGLGQYSKSIYIPDATVMNEEAFQVNLIMENTNIAPDMAPSVMKAVTEMEDVHKLDVPAYVSQRLPELVSEFQSRLISDGIDPSRISTMSMTGVHRRTLKGRIQNAPEVSHLVTVLDKDDSSHQVVVDPFVAVMTPVRDPNRSILDQYDSASSPLSDIPMISPIRDYVYGDYLWFDKLNWVQNKVPAGR